ncbi:MAG: molybdopterin-binding protein [Gammaproteobacteria bacterium]|jgi:molybdopterin-biosynthesis enzyme MoeA-like protein
MNNPRQFGLLVIGDEILAGKRTDSHCLHVIETLDRRGLQLAWARFAGDDRRRLVRELRITAEDTVPVFCFGGIGATPDDRTRQAAAEAFDAPLVRNPEALAMIEERFGGEAYPNRVRMADLPEHAVLIPNAYNRIPGFSLYDHHFLPGFPVMAWPMLEWVLDQYYPAVHLRRQEASARVINVRESDLLPLMEALSARHPDAGLFSLPHLGEVNSIEIGFRGEQAVVAAALAELVSCLQQRELLFEIVNASGDVPDVSRAAF